MSELKKEDKFVINKTKTPIVKEDKTVLYCIFGEQDELDENGLPITSNEETALAKSVRRNNNEKYYIKVGTAGKLANPANYLEKSRHSRSSHNTGVNQFKFIEVRPDVFDLYLSFLKTKNAARLVQAERAML